MSRKARAATVVVGEPIFYTEDSGSAFDLWPSAPTENPYPNDAWEDSLPIYQTQGSEFVDTPSQNVAAFLYMIRRAEHTAADVASGADYGTFYGGARFSDFSNHPVITGELSPVKLPESMCRNAGYSSGVCYSSAAGAYQFIKPTWLAQQRKVPYLTDFSPASQDQAAIRLLDQIGALKYVRSGEIETAIRLAGSQWASLPGSTAKQGAKTMQTALAYFADGGGVA